MLNQRQVYPIGFTFTMNNKRKDVCTVIDHYTTTNSKGEIVDFRYVCVHQFMGQMVTDRNVCHTTIVRSVGYDANHVN